LRRSISGRLRGWAPENASDFNSPIITDDIRERSLDNATTILVGARRSAAWRLFPANSDRFLWWREWTLSAPMHLWDGWRIAAGGKTACDTLWINENSGSQAGCGIAEWFRSQLFQEPDVDGNCRFWNKVCRSDAIKQSSRMTNHEM
jgi:hypothetical protein